MPSSDRITSATITPEQFDAISADLDMASNLFGALSVDVRSRLVSLIAEPTTDGWDDCHGIILDAASWLTLWQAILAVDPTFPQRGRCTDARGRVVADWPQVPSRALILSALRYATH